MNRNITEYKTLVFDCDGVVLDSNKLKTDAFYEAALPYGEAAAQALVDYHLINGGISRYKKFALFLGEIVPAHATGTDRPDLDALLDRYAKQVQEGLLACNVAAGLKALREKTAHARWLIVSGGDQAELRVVFSQRGLADFFDGGIFGSPNTKEEILAREVASNNIQQPAILIGDSRYDYKAAESSGLEFIFLTQWTDFFDWPSYCLDNNIVVASSLKDIIE